MFITVPATLVVLVIISTTWAQSIFIDNVPEYDQLASCAEQPLSIVVRSMASGCGDSGHTTSYSCFCSQSYSDFSSIISREVIKTCSSHSDDASSALAVFSSYCQIGAAAIPTGSGTTAGMSSSPAPASAVSPVPTSPAITSSSSFSAAAAAGLPTSSKVVIGVVVPVGSILLLGGITFAALRIRSHRRHAARGVETGTQRGSGSKDINPESSIDQWSDRSHSPSITTRFPWEAERTLAEQLKLPPIELPTDGRYGNGTAAHELQE